MEYVQLYINFILNSEILRSVFFVKETAISILKIQIQVPDVNRSLQHFSDIRYLRKCIEYVLYISSFLTGPFCYFV